MKINRYFDTLFAILNDNDWGFPEEPLVLVHQAFFYDQSKALCLESYGRQASRIQDFYNNLQSVLNGPQPLGIYNTYFLESSQGGLSIEDKDEIIAEKLVVLQAISEALSEALMPYITDEGYDFQVFNDHEFSQSTYALSRYYMRDENEWRGRYQDVEAIFINKPRSTPNKALYYAGAAIAGVAIVAGIAVLSVATFGVGTVAVIGVGGAVAATGIAAGGAISKVGRTARLRRRVGRFFRKLLGRSTPEVVIEPVYEAAFDVANPITLTAVEASELESPENMVSDVADGYEADSVSYGSRTSTADAIVVSGIWAEHPEWENPETAENSLFADDEGKASPPGVTSTEIIPGALANSLGSFLGAHDARDAASRLAFEP